MYKVAIRDYRNLPGNNDLGSSRKVEPDPLGGSKGLGFGVSGSGANDLGDLTVDGYSVAPYRGCPPSANPLTYMCQHGTFRVAKTINPQPGQRHCGTLW